MTGLLEFREKIKLIYSKNEVFILPVIKFLLAFLTLSVINGQMGYMTRLDNMAIVLVAALFCSFLPVGFLVMFAALFSLLHMYALSLEAALVGMVVYMLLFLLFLRFTPKESLVVVLTPILCYLKVPYVMPVAMGLLGSPASAVSVGCGVVVYYLMHTIILNAPNISTMEAEEAAAKIRLLIDGILGNKEMVVMIAAFTITVLVVYLIRRMSIDYSWTIAIIAGVMTNLVILLIGDLIYDTNMSVINAVIGVIVAAVAGKVIEFFRFCVDYSRTEKVQFEDDEYYYYVKAIPKMTVAAPTKTVKKINTQRRSAQSTVSSRNTNAGRTGSSGSRSVTTERTASSRSGYSQTAQNTRNDYRGSGRSVTINSDNVPVDENNDYEDLY